MLTSLRVTEFLDETAANSPAPGGGSVAALAASLGAALTSMVCRLTIGKKKYIDVQTEMESVLKQSEELRAQFTAMIDEDTAAFNKVMEAFALQKDTDEQKAVRNAAIQNAIKAATLVPLKLLELCTESIRLVKIVAEKGNQNSLSDAGVAAWMIRAGAEGATLNVKINLNSIQDVVFIEQTQTNVRGILHQIHTATEDILSKLGTSL
jgi:methenyltetrahydrofolate cyclohydrolase